MRHFFLILHYLSILGLAVLRYVPTLKNSKSPLLKDVATYVSNHIFYIAAIPAGYIFSYSIWFMFLKLRQKRKKFIRNFLQRINSECFHKDLEHHRITLFKEISWVRAILRNYYYLFYHLILYRPKWKFYLAWPRRGRYLMVYLRCGLHFEKSSTMFQVELNEEKKCTGVAGYIRYRRVSAKIENLPDITDIDLAKPKQIEDLTPEDSKNRVKDYMKRGLIRNFKDLKKIHRKARHFYGTIIERKGQHWGVLLVDSTSERSPFTGTNKKRVDSFALTIGDMIDLEV